MRAFYFGVGLMILLGACSSQEQERVRDFNEDGVFLYQRGNYSAARDSFKAALALRPEDPGLLYNLGQCYDLSRDGIKAEKFYLQCLQRDPNHEACRHALTMLLVKEGRRADAAHMVDDWMAREPKLAAPYAEDGWLWHQTGDLPRAQYRLQQALELDPHNKAALTELALVYEGFQRGDRAMAIYEGMLEREPNQPEIKRHVDVLLAKGVKRPRPD